MIYADFESILVPEDNKKENSDMKWRSDMNKYQEHIACSYGHKLVFVDDKISKRFKSYFGEDAVYNSINSVTEENQYSRNILTKSL